MYYISFNEKKKNGEYNWGVIPNKEWKNFLENLDNLEITSIGFENILSSIELEDYYSLPSSLVENKNSTYTPYHNKSYNEIKLFKLNEQIIQTLENSSLSEIGKKEDEVFFDEIIFFNQLEAKYVWVPYENLILLQNFSLKDKLLLTKFCPKLANNIRYEKS